MTHKPGGHSWVVSLEERMADSHEAEGAVPSPTIAVVGCLTPKSCGAFVVGNHLDSRPHGKSFRKGLRLSFSAILAVLPLPTGL